MNNQIFRHVLRYWTNNLIDNPGKNAPVEMVYDPVTKYIVDTTQNKPSYIEYEQKHEKTSIIRENDFNRDK